MDQAATSDSGKGRHGVILCHPDSQSFNRSIADAYCQVVRANGQEAVLRDLYDLEFDPVLRSWERPTVPNFTVSPDVARELSILRTCDILVLVYPIWFGTPPAMMKGYVERVLGSGVDPKSVVSRTPTSFLAGRRLLSFTTSATSAPWLNEQGEWLALRYLFDHYLTHAFGMQADEHVHFASIINGLQPRWAEQHLYDVSQHAHRTCALVTADRHRAAAQGQAQGSTAA